MLRLIAGACFAAGIWLVGSIAPAAADSVGEWAAQPCEQSILAPPPGFAGAIACRVRDASTEGVSRRGGNATCDFRNYSMHPVASAPAAPYFSFFVVGGFDNISRCAALWYAPDQVQRRLMNFDDLTRKGSGWSEPVKLADDTTALQFVSESGRRCVAFQKMGEAKGGGAGAATRIDGYYCGPAGAGGTLGNDVMLRDIGYARVRN